MLEGSEFTINGKKVTGSFKEEGIFLLSVNHFMMPICQNAAVVPGDVLLN
jgi:hypothetical protein